MHPSTSRVNSQQSAMAATRTRRPSPPSTKPPPPPLVNSSAANHNIIEVSDGTIKAERMLPAAFVPKPQLDDELSTAIGSSDGEHEEDSPRSSGSPAETVLDQTVVGRHLMLLHRSLCLRVPGPPRGLHCRPVMTAPPPGLSLPPALPAGFAPPPGLEPPSKTAPTKPTYSPPTFRKELMATFKELGADRNVAKAVRRIRAQGVPLDRQAAEFADAITYVLEERRGCARRSFIAFAAGLVGAFDKAQCVAGLKLFFGSVYPDLQEEVPKLAKIVNIELLPTLGSALSVEELQPFAAIVASG